MMSKIVSFQLHTGYVESASIGSLCISHSEGFDTVEEGLADFVETTREVMAVCTEKDNSYNQVKKSACCRATLKKIPDATSCAKCRNVLVLEPLEITNEEVSQYIDSLLGLTLDSWGGEPWEEFQRRGWDVPGVLGGTLAVVHNFSADLQESVVMEYSVYEVTFVEKGKPTKAHQERFPGEEE